MRKLLAAPVLLMCLAAAAAPEPSASPPVLPEIGRTRAIAPACAALRDLVIPAFTAARRADARFDETQKRLSRYANFSTDTKPTRLHDALNDATIDNGSAYRESELSRIGGDAAQLLQESQRIKKALDDPRLTAETTDAQVLAERAQLKQLYDAQQARAAALNEFVQRENATLGVQRVGLGSDRGIAPKPADGRGGIGPAPREEATPPVAVPATPPPGMPSRLGYEAADRSALGTWGNRLALSVRASENDAAKTFFQIANNCR